MLTFLIAIGFSIAFYRIGYRLMLKNRIFNETKNEFLSYASFMMSGVVVGEYFSIKWIPLFFHISNFELILFTTIISIFLGEVIYYRNLRLMSRIITSINKE